jgi:DNA-binding beta-propeller fold protein YncE
VNEDWSAEGDIIGDVGKVENDFVERLKIITPREFDLNSLSIKSLSGLCTLDDKLLLVDSDENQILLLNKNFELEDRIKKIGNESFNSPLNICTDQHGETVYLIDYSNNRVLIIDRNIKTIKKVLFNDDNISIGNLIDISFYGDCLFVLDNLASNIKLIFIQW